MDWKRIPEKGRKGFISLLFPRWRKKDEIWMNSRFQREKKRGRGRFWEKDKSQYWEGIHTHIHRQTLLSFYFVVVGRFLTSSTFLQQQQEMVEFYQLFWKFGDFKDIFSEFFTPIEKQKFFFFNKNVAFFEQKSFHFK